MARINPNEKPIGKREDGTKIWAYNQKGQPVCNSLLHDSSGNRCRSPRIMYPSGRCRKHGGKCKIGPAHHSFKHGRTSAHFGNAKLGQKVAQLMEDQNYLSLRFEIATTKARLAEMEEQLYVSLDQVTLRHLRNIAAGFELGLAEEDKIKRRKTLELYAKRTIELAARGTLDKAWWEEYRHTQTHLTGLIREERSTRKEHDVNFSPVEVLAMLTQFMTVVKRLEDDNENLRKYSLCMAQIIENFDLPALPGGDEETIDAEFTAEG